VDNIRLSNVTEKKAVNIKTAGFNSSSNDKGRQKRKNMQIDMVLLNTMMPMHSSMILILMPHTKL
jgi:hypothetical protein